MRSTAFGTCTLVVLALGTLFAALQVHADVYMHYPPGSNNRLDEQNQNRAAPNRLFDSQNNDRGGYNVVNFNYYSGTELNIEWTAQHGCGVNHPNVHCEFVLQYTCDDISSGLRDGTPSQQNDNNNQPRRIPDDALQSKSLEYGMHESYQYYQDCKTRSRNRGLFTADQNVGTTTPATRTRQNPNGNRNGFECPEERDYYPYWHPAPWVDIAVLTDRTENCALYQSESQNVKAKNYCSDMRFNNAVSCRAANATWLEKPAWGVAAPDCQPTPYSRDNHLGNTIGGYPIMYNWTIPTALENKRCVVRLRYNLSSADIPFNANSSWNGRVQNNPQRTVFGTTFQLNIDSSQVPRTFQDRSHSFVVMPRTPELMGRTIRNLSNRGRRGNIVQVFPAVEYDFVPEVLYVNPGDGIHFQTGGSNTSPAGAGEGEENTDRSNMVEIEGMGKNWPIHPSKAKLMSSTLMFNQFAFMDNEGHGSTGTLDDKGPYWNGGIIWVTKAVSSLMEIFYMGSRNNNFSNRSQKGRILIAAPGGGSPAGSKSTGTTSPMTDSQVAGVAVGTTLAFFAIVAAGGAAIYYRSRPDDKKRNIKNSLATAWRKVTCRGEPRPVAETRKRGRSLVNRFSLRAQPRDAFSSAYAQFGSTRVLKDGTTAAVPSASSPQASSSEVISASGASPTEMSPTERNASQAAFANAMNKFSRPAAGPSAAERV